MHCRCILLASVGLQCIRWAKTWGLAAYSGRILVLGCFGVVRRGRVWRLGLLVIRHGGPYVQGWLTEHGIHLLLKNGDIRWRWVVQGFWRLGRERGAPEVLRVFWRAWT